MKTVWILLLGTILISGLYYLALSWQIKIGKKRVAVTRMREDMLMSFINILTPPRTPKEWRVLIPTCEEIDEEYRKTFPERQVTSLASIAKSYASAEQVTH